MNTASRMEYPKGGKILSNAIRCSDTTYNKLKTTHQLDYSGELEVKGKGLVKTCVLKKRVMSNEEAEEQAKHEEELNIGKENSQSVSFPQNNVPPPTPQRLESATVGGVGTNRGPPTSIPQSIEEHESDIDDQKHVVCLLSSKVGAD